jgi:hypothetical protein
MTECKGRYVSLDGGYGNTKWICFCAAIDESHCILNTAEQEQAMTDTSRTEVERVAGEVSENAGNIGRTAAALLLAVTAERDASNALLREWLNTELDEQDEDYANWLCSFTERVEAALKGTP